MSTADNSLYPIAILVDELKHEDVQIRLNSVSRVHVIAKALGPERTREELIPFLTESLDDEDEVLLVLADQLGSFVEYTGGEMHAYLLLTPMESLATVDEATVRDMAIKSICAIVEQMPQEHIQHYFIPLIQRLATRDWFTSRIAACSLFSIAYTNVESLEQTELLKMFAQLCHDETPMVRKAAATACPSLVPVVASNSVVSELLPLFLALAQDKQDSVRIHIFDAAIAIAQRIPCEVLDAELLPVILTIARDGSWRVRWSVANKFSGFIELESTRNVYPALCDCFVGFLRDSEAEVRTVAASKVVAVCRVLPPNLIVERMIPCFKMLAIDASDHVRCALGSVLMKIAPFLGRDVTIEHLLPLVFLLLNDQNSEVRLNVISNMEQGHSVIGMELLSQSLSPAIVHLAQDRQWRIRLAVIECIPILAGQLGKEYFEENLLGLCTAWLIDSVYCVRDAATLVIRKLTEGFGIDWAVTHIFPKVVEMQSSANYLHRLTSLNALKSICGVLNSEIIENSILAIVIGLAQDPVPNIRFNVAKTLESVAIKLNSQVLESKVRPSLRDLCQDQDQDVQFFASRALSALA